MDTLEQTIRKIKEFRDARDWMQFHSPKNLACSISIEANELLEHFQWTSLDESAITPEKREAIAHEIADVGFYLIELADNLGINLIEAIAQKLVINEAKYPAERVRGSARKYTEYPQDPQ